MKVWDAQTGQELLIFPGHTNGVVDSVVFSPDGTRLASSSNDGTIKIWDATTSPGRRIFGGQTGAVFTGVAFSPDGKRLAAASGTWDATKKAHVAWDVKVWKARTGQELLTLKGHTGRIFSVAFSPDGKRLACGSGKWDAAKRTFVAGEVNVWDAQTGQELWTFKGHTAAVVSVTFSPDSTRLASSSSLPSQVGSSGDPGEPGEVKVWDAHTGRELLTLKGHRRFVDSVTFSPDGKRLATLARDNTKVWDAQTGQEILTLNVRSSSAGTVAFSPDGKRLATVTGWDKIVKVWDAQTGQELLALRGDAVMSLAFSPDGKRLASDSVDAVKVWDAQTGQEVFTLPLKGRTGWWRSVVLSPDGRRLATNGPAGMVTVWDATPLPQKP